MIAGMYDLLFSRWLISSPIAGRQHGVFGENFFALIGFRGGGGEDRRADRLKEGLSASRGCRPFPADLSSLTDDAKCFELVRPHRWPDGVCCPSCGSASVTRHGRDDTRPHRRRYPSA